MKLALISLVQENTDGPGPVGLNALFDEKIVDHQIAVAKSLGAEKFLLISSNMAGPLLQHVDLLKQDGQDIQIVRNGSDIARFAEVSERFLFLSDAILPGSETAEKLAEEPTEMILVAENSDRFAEFERVDLAHRWLGIAILQSSRLKEMNDIPPDWNMGSALLRTAVQAQCRREVVTEEQMESGALFALENSEKVVGYVTRQLQNEVGRPRNFLEKFATWPLAQWVTRKLESVPQSGQYLGGTTILLGFFASVTAWFEWAIPALFLLIAGQVVLKQLEAMELLSIGRHRGADLGRLSLIAVPMVLLTLSAKLSVPAAVNANSVVTVVLMLILVFLKSANISSRLEMVRPDLLLVLVFVLAGALFGQIFTGIYVGLIYCSAILAISAVTKSAKS